MLGNHAISENSNGAVSSPLIPMPPGCGVKLDRISRERDLKIICKTGTPAIITKNSGDQLVAPVIFDAPWMGSQVGTFESDTQAPQFKCRSEDVDGVDRGDQVFVQNNNFEIVSAPEEDGTGLTVFLLRPIL